MNTMHFGHIYPPPLPTIPRPPTYTSQLLGIFFFLNNPPSPISAARMCTSVGPSTRLWTSTGGHTAEEHWLLSSAAMTCSKCLSPGTSWAPSLPMLKSWLAGPVQVLYRLPQLPLAHSAMALQVHVIFFFFFFFCSPSSKPGAWHLSA